MSNDEQDLLNIVNLLAAADNRILEDFVFLFGIDLGYPNKTMAKGKDGGLLTNDDPDSQADLATLLENARIFSNEMGEVIYRMATTLLNNSEPVERRRKRKTGDPLAKGSIEAKYIRHRLYDWRTGLPRFNEDGTPKYTKWFGPYLYYRVWASGGGKNRDQQKLVNKYIGYKGLAAIYHMTPPGSEKRRELERLIVVAYETHDDQKMLDLERRIEGEVKYWLEIE